MLSRISLSSTLSTPQATSTADPARAIATTRARMIRGKLGSCTHRRGTADCWGPSEEAGGQKRRLSRRLYIEEHGTPRGRNLGHGVQ